MLRSVAPPPLPRQHLTAAAPPIAAAQECIVNCTATPTSLIRYNHSPSATVHECVIRRTAIHIHYSRYLQTCCILFSKTFSTSVLGQMTFSTIQKLRWIPRSLQIGHSYFLVDLTTSLQQTSWGISRGLSFLHKILTPPGEAHAYQVSRVSTQEHSFIFAL